MNKYWNNLNDEIKKYFSILSPEFPEWLNEYINTNELLRLNYISTTCGTIYSDLFDNNFSFSTLDHSVAVALIVWNFTHDKKQTLSGLFHDIATPTFKHCVDFLNGDYMIQESTEDMTTEIIKNSDKIMKLLNKDNIKISDVDNYHLYPIADNDTPKLSADRLEYSLSNALFHYKLLDIDEIKEIYKDICIQRNEEHELELGFQKEENAIKFVEFTSKLSIIYREDRTRYSMQLLADILKRLNNDKKISKKDLYKLKEEQVIKIIEESKYSKIFNTWKKALKIKTSKEEPKNVYYVHQGAKIRYINPLYNGKRISECSKKAKKMIEENLSYDMNNYVYLDIDFE